MEVTVYSKPACAFCDKAKTLLTGMNINYTEKVFDVGQQKAANVIYEDMTTFKSMYPDVRSVPQIFIDGNRIGGFEELKSFLATRSSVRLVK